MIVAIFSCNYVFVILYTELYHLLHYQHGFLTHSITYHVTGMCTYTSSNYLPSQLIPDEEIGS